ncbi:hypothetical protein VW35_08265 [Devosia soli]|uniref:Uncharacterized protein n=1 Tax=Devosia soli TaxID=361041 RepID=A0A0F5LDT9_9HYPH|nr:hypothetical protein [Devosia soli]KKB80369.1 hypothetical protein VW35_08265 [Devosia soli]
MKSTLTFSDLADVESRIRASRKLLQGWRWMSKVSCRREEAIALLLQEAKFLIDLGRQHPARAVEIGRLIVAYQRLVEAIRAASCSQTSEVTPSNED